MWCLVRFYTRMSQGLQTVILLYWWTLLLNINKLTWQPVHHLCFASCTLCSCLINTWAAQGRPLRSVLLSWLVLLEIMKIIIQRVYDNWLLWVGFSEDSCHQWKSCKWRGLLTLAPKMDYLEAFRAINNALSICLSYCMGLIRNCNFIVRLNGWETSTARVRQRHCLLQCQIPEY